MVAVLLTVFCCAAVDAADPRPPTQLPMKRIRPKGRKFEIYMAHILCENGADFSILAHGRMGYDRRPITITVGSPDKKEVSKQKIDVPKGPFKLKTDVGANGKKGVYTLTIQGEGSYWHILSDLKTEPAMKIVYPFAGRFVRLSKCRYYFEVPVKTKAISLTVQGYDTKGTEFAIIDADGNEVLKASFSTPKQGSKRSFDIEVKPEQAGKLWRLDGVKGQVVLTLKGAGAKVPSFFAVEADQHFMP